MCLIDTLLVVAMSMYISVGHSCGRPRAPTNGRVDTSAGTSFGDVVRYLCDIGYMLSGVAERRCQADKRWSGNVPTCASEQASYPCSSSVAHWWLGRHTLSLPPRLQLLTVAVQWHFPMGPTLW